MEDENIIQLYFDRDEKAIQNTAEKYGTKLRKVSYGITSDIFISEECENDTYLKAWKLIPPNKPVTYFYSFLACIIRHISIDYCRKRSGLKRSSYITELTEELSMCIPSSDDVEKSMDNKQLGETISMFLKTLPQEKRVAFIRRYFYMDNISEISTRLSVSESKVKTMLFRMRGELKKYLQRGGYYP